MHILYHLVEDISRFGSPVFYETEKGEQFNKFIREALFRTNRQNPSRDVANAFGKRLVAHHVLTGGFWIAAGRMVQANPKVLHCTSSFRPAARSFANNDDTSLKLQVGSIGVFSNEYGNLLIGEVTKVDVSQGSFTVAEYALVGLEDEDISRFNAAQSGDSAKAVYLKCKKTRAGHLLARKLVGVHATISTAQGKFVEVLDISQKLPNDVNCHLLNVNKFGSFWWALSHYLI